MHHHVRRSLAAGGGTALLAAALLTSPGAHAAAAVTCQGKDVTIDGTGTPTVTGTPGNDVILASLGASVSGLAGDDTICLVPGAATTATTVDPGDGNDSVDASALPAGAVVTATLGAGDDTYTGGAAVDRVASGIAGQPNADVLSLGLGDDVLEWHGTQAATGSADLGAGANTLVDGDGGVVAIDATRLTVDRAGSTVLRWKGTVTTYVVESTATTAAFTGTAAAETLVVRDGDAAATPTKVAADMAGGDDTVTLRADISDGSTWNGGDGRDLVQVARDYGELVLDLDRGQLETGAPDVTPDQSVKGFEDVDAVTRAMTVKGTAGPNVLNLQGCDLRAVGRAGADTIGVGVELDDAPAIACTLTKLVARGGKDADRIVGSAGPDRLFGNRGEDSIDAMGGHDVVFGGLDDDRLKGGTGDDKVRGGQGNDEVGGDEGRDRVQGDKGNDRLLGQAGDDVLVGGQGFDRANGGPGFDRCRSAERRWQCER